MEEETLLFRPILQIEGGSSETSMSTNEEQNIQPVQEGQLAETVYPMVTEELAAILLEEEEKDLSYLIQLYPGFYRHEGKILLTFLKVATTKHTVIAGLNNVYLERIQGGLGPSTPVYAGGLNSSVFKKASRYLRMARNSRNMQAK